ncbi:MAG TPA: class I SAM-dependent methyltransferase, partial [Longimicrobiaceae bacterium]|nr:class I SAM-dependent methyltransferase [Longimicrobiaceae bacterium]
MSRTIDEVRADFDRIARLSERAAPEPSPYLDWVLDQLPARCGEALEVGCGTGELTARLAERSARVLAIDLSPEMIRVARSRSAGRSNVGYLVADAAGWSFPRERFDCIVSVATLHHLPLQPTLRKLREALRPGGTLVIQD